MDEHSAERLAAIVEFSFDAIISKDLFGAIVSWNKAAERLFGYPESETVGQSIYLIIPDDKWDEEADILRRLKLGERIETFQTTRRHRDGRTVPSRAALASSSVHLASPGTSRRRARTIAGSAF